MMMIMKKYVEYALTHRILQKNYYILEDVPELKNMHEECLTKWRETQFSDSNTAGGVCRYDYAFTEIKPHGSLVRLQQR